MGYKDISNVTRGFPGMDTEAAPVRAVLTREEGRFLFSLLCGLEVKASRLQAAEELLIDILGKALRGDGTRMFHWAQKWRGYFEVSSVSTGEMVRLGSFYIVEGDGSCADKAVFEPSEFLNPASFRGQ